MTYESLKNIRFTLFYTKVLYLLKRILKKNIQPVVVIKTVFITFLYGKIPRNSYKLYMYNFKSFFSILQWWYDIFKRDTMIHFSIKNKWQKLFTCTCIKLNAWVKRSYHDFLPSYPRRSFHLENKFYHDIYMYIIKTQGIGGNFDFSLLFFFLSGCFVCKCVLFLVRHIFPLFKQYIYTCILRGSAL